MKPRRLLSSAEVLARFSPLIALLLVVAAFGLGSPAFLTAANLSSVLVQSSWLIVAAVGMHFVLLTAGVDLSIGSTMYVSAVVLAVLLRGQSVPVCLLAAIAVGAVLGTLNAGLIARMKLPPFVVTLALAFVGRGIGLLLSDTRVVLAEGPLVAFGRARLVGMPAPFVVAAAAFGVSAFLLQATPLGAYVRATGADTRKARKAGVPTTGVTWTVYILAGAFAGLAGFVSLSQTSSASAAFGVNAEFSAIAAAVLGGGSLFGGRGGVWAPVIGAVLITLVQNGLVLMNANPYANPVITGGVIFIAALIDGLRSRVTERLERRQIRAN